MKTETLKTLANEATSELKRDNAGDRNFDGTKAFAAEYVYFRAMREGRVGFCDDRKENEKSIREVTRAMRTANSPLCPKGQPAATCPTCGEDGRGTCVPG